MLKKRIITIAGRPGSGKSTTAKAIASKLGFEHFSSGDLFRAFGKQRGIDVLQTNLSAEQNAEVDYLVDNKLREIGAKEDQKVIDSRTAWHWIPISYKVFLDLDLMTGAQRILNNASSEKRANEHTPDDPATYARVLQQRLDSETRRYKALYGIDPYNMANYDLVIDTAKNDIEQVVEQIIKGFQGWLES